MPSVLPAFTETPFCASLALAGEKCERIMGRLIVNVPVQDVQADEIWGFVQKKEAKKREQEKNNDSIGDA